MPAEPEQLYYLSSNGLRLKTNNRIIYVYAYSPAGNREWTGDDRRFFNGEFYNMREATMSVDEDGDYTFSLSCDD